MSASTGLATVEQVAKRAGEDPNELTDVDVELIQSLIDIVSEDVRAAGAPWPSPVLAPAIARTTTIKAAARGYMNAGGYQLERGDMLTLQRSDLFANAETLSETERLALKRAAGNAVGSIPMQREVIVDGYEMNETGGYPIG